MPYGLAAATATMHLAIHTILPVGALEFKSDRMKHYKLNFLPLIYMLLLTVLWTSQISLASQIPQGVY